MTMGANLNENSHFARIDMREICKVLSVTPLRSSIIVHKLEILPKTSRFPVSVSTPPTHKPKKADSKRVKNGAIYGMSHTLSTHSAISLNVFSF